MGLVAATLAAILLSSCGGSSSNEEQAQNDNFPTNEDEGRHVELTISSTEEADDETQDFTPIVADVPQAPIPFAGSDDRTHLVYELAATNFSSGETTIDQLEVLDADTGDVIDTLDTEEVAGLSAAGRPSGSRRRPRPVDDGDHLLARDLRRSRRGARPAGPPVVGAGRSRPTRSTADHRGGGTNGCRPP